jgi:hypothetical protein
LSDRRAEVRFRSVPERLDQLVSFERLLDDSALDSLAAAVNETNLAEAGGMSGCHVFVDDRLDIAWRERVKVERVFDRDAVGHEAV